MKTKTNTPKTAAAKTEAPAEAIEKIEAPTPVPAPAPAPKTKAAKAGKAEKAVKASKKAKKEKEDGETTDRLPTNLNELKDTKGGLVAYLFLNGKDIEAIAQEVKTTFKVADTQAVKITRRITGRVRLYRRIFDLVPTKGA
jgi:hypothetical protein